MHLLVMRRCPGRRPARPNASRSCPAWSCRRPSMHAQFPKLLRLPSAVHFILYDYSTLTKVLLVAMRKLMMVMCIHLLRRYQNSRRDSWYRFMILNAGQSWHAGAAGFGKHALQADHSILRTVWWMASREGLRVPGFAEADPCVAS